MKEFYYLTHSQQVIRVEALHRPNSKNAPKAGWKYVVCDYDGWRKAILPLTWTQLKPFTYIGTRKKPVSTGFAD